MNTQLYSPTNNYMLTRELPVSFESQKREFDRVTELIVANAPEASGSDQADMNKHPVADVLESVAENLLTLSSSDGITVPEGSVELPSKTDLPVEDVAVVPDDTTAVACTNDSNAVLSMPDLSEFMPVVANARVEPVRESLCDVEPMEVGVVPNSPVVDSFGQLLKVDGAHCLLLDEMNKPLLELVSPISSPNVLNDDNIEVVTVEKNSVVINTPVLANRSGEQSEVLIHTVNAEIHSESGEIAKKPKGSVVAKENTRLRNNAPKVASTCKKVNPNQRKKGFASNLVKENSVKRCRKTDETCREHGDFSVDDIRMQCKSDFRIPLRSRVLILVVQLWDIVVMMTIMRAMMGCIGDIVTWI